MSRHKVRPALAGQSCPVTREDKRWPANHVPSQGRTSVDRPIMSRPKVRQALTSQSCPMTSAVIADASHRFHRLLACERSIFSTGTDEHGTKIQEAAAKAKTQLPQYCHNISLQYESLFQHYDILYTDFIRTTEEKHKKAVSHFWDSLKSNGYIYSGNYSGWYCVPDEQFLSENHLKEERGQDGKIHKVSIESGHPVQWMQEQNYLFKLSSFQEDLIHWLKNDKVVQPAKFCQQLRNWVLDAEFLQDVSVSRPSSRVHWGIAVPGDSSQTVYVWLDALVNYLTVAGYPHSSFVQNWPPDLQVVGKDILKFHGVYWPAFLLAAGLEPPRALFCHSHWTVDGEKMSKSKGNVVDPVTCMSKFTSSGLRYFLLREGTAHSDANYSETKVIRVLNAELADTLGNLLNRCCGKTVNPRQTFPKFCAQSQELYNQDEAKRLVETVTDLPDAVCQHFKECNFYKGIDAIITTLHTTNRFFEIQKPWELVKHPKEQERLDWVIHLTMETLRVCGIMLQPIVPKLAELMLNKLGILENERMWSHIKPLSWEKELGYTVPISKEQTMLFRRIALK
uniref:Methionine--tRNA ligase, mitochondrial n=1 Tax=Timema cristinae TaxID=61476 RepID=A0A7R9CV89_TIMCR|nr:unnamed protein product [Timema cristinae]